MRKSTMNILFFVKKNAPKKNGYCTVMVRLTLDGEQIHFSSKLEINPTLWNQKANKVIGRSEEARNINRMLDSVRMDLHSIYRDLSSTKYRITSAKIKQAFIGQGEETTLVYLFKEHIGFMRQRVGVNLTEVTCYKYEQALGRIVGFVKKNYGSDNIQVADVDLRFLESFYLYLRKTHECAHNTAMRYMEKFAAVMNYAERTGKVAHNPFMHYRMYFEKTDPVFLIESEVSRIYEKKFHTQRLVEIRDIFIFCCFTGLSFADVQSLRKSDIKPAFDDNEWVLIRRTKTDVVAHIPLLQIPLSIANKYRESYKGDALFPVKCNQKTNEYLKEIAELCGIEKNLTFHMARYTFANLMCEYGVSIESLSRMMGHRTIRTTQGYVNITDRKVKREMTAIASQFHI